MRALLLACLLGAVASVHGRYCNQANYVCVSGREFCLGNIVFECAEGTDCTGSVNGQSPCTMGNSAKPVCPGDFDDYACCDSGHYCLGGYKHKCSDGKKCLGVKEPGGNPCHTVTRSGSTGSLPTPDVPAIPATCPGNGNWACTSDTTFCEDGCEIKCPKNTVCKDWAPCVHKTSCYEPGGHPPVCNGTDWTCIDDRDYCQNSTMWRCPEGTKCTGQVNGSSPCSADVPRRCPGPFDDYQCVGKDSYCLGGYAQKCAENTYCNPGSEDDSPCSTTPPTAPVCPQPDYACVNYNSFCANGIGFNCPDDSVCRGFAPCATVPDETCDKNDYSCIDHREYCFQGAVLRCPEGFKCAGSDGSSSPCQEEEPAKRCPGPFDDYTCFDINHYCLDGVGIECPENTWCYGNVAEDESPCQLEKPTNLTCSLPNWSCSNTTTYCYDGLPYTCPETTECKGLAPYPCVEKSWCPADDKKDDHKPSCDKPDCPTHPPKEPECSDVDWKCYGKKEYCYKGEILRCPKGTHCSGNRNGKHCCVEEPPKPVCPGAWGDYQCCDWNKFCLGGFQMPCAPGTVCIGSTRGESPCKWPTTPIRPTCANGDYSCTGDKTFCSGGVDFTCPGGAVCRGGSCVYHSGDDECPGCY